MLTICVLAQKKKDITFDEFKSYALNNHAELVKSAAGDLRPLKYCQNYVFDGLWKSCDKEKAQLYVRDSVIEVWRENIEAISQYSKTNFGSVIIPEDEEKFADRHETLGGIMRVHDHMEWNSYESNKCRWKVFAAMEKNSAVSDTEFAEMWKQTHKMIITQIPGIDDIICKYESRVLFNDASTRHAHEDKMILSGLAVMYFKDRSNCSIINKYWDLLMQADKGLNFLNTEHCFWLACEEYRIIG